MKHLVDELELKIFSDRTKTDGPNLFLTDSEFQNGGHDRCRDAALCCSWTWKRAGEAVPFIRVKGEEACCYRPCLQVCVLLSQAMFKVELCLVSLSLKFSIFLFFFWECDQTKFSLKHEHRIIS